MFIKIKNLHKTLSLTEAESGCKVTVFDASHLYTALLSLGPTVNVCVFVASLPPVEYVTSTWSSFRNQIRRAGGLPPLEMQARVNLSPTCTISPSWYPSICGGPGGTKGAEIGN